jgi:RNA:NAD 2'-phosphotransferase (TPT1/KptA family)
MKEFTEVTESMGVPVYYHVTFATRVPAIMKQGLLPGKRRNWNNSFGAKQGSTKLIYLFEDFTSAARWGAHMEWEFEKPVEVLVIHAPPGLIIADDHIQMQLGGHSAVTTDEAIPAEAIKRSIPITDDMKREIAKTGHATEPE